MFATNLSLYENTLQSQHFSITPDPSDVLGNTTLHFSLPRLMHFCCCCLIMRTHFAEWFLGSNSNFFLSLKHVVKSFGFLPQYQHSVENLNDRVSNRPWSRLRHPKLGSFGSRWVIPGLTTAVMIPVKMAAPSASWDRAVGEVWRQWIHFVQICLT